MIFTKPFILFLFSMNPGVDHFCFSLDCPHQSVEIEREAEKIDYRANIKVETRIYHHGRRRDVEPFNFVLDDCVLKSDFRKIVVFTQLAWSWDSEINHKEWKELVTMAASAERCVETSEIYLQRGKYAYAVCDTQTLLISTFQGDYCSKSQEVVDILSYSSVRGD